jgi:uncharacterized protein (TIGR03086 family)
MDGSPIELLARAFASTRGEVDAIDREQLTLATPCPPWDVRLLLNPVIGAAEWYTATIREGVSPPIDGVDDDYAAGDYHATYAEWIQVALDAFRAPGALERSVTYVGRDIPGVAVMRLCALDTFAHGWDLARSLGRSTELDAEVADELLTKVAPQVPASFRGTGEDALYQPPADTPADATAADRLAAYLGRSLSSS